MLVVDPRCSYICFFSGGGILDRRLCVAVDLRFCLLLFSCFFFFRFTLNRRLCVVVDPQFFCLLVSLVFVAAVGQLSNILGCQHTS